MSKKDQDTAVLIGILLLFLFRPKGTSDVQICYIDPQTGECLPVQQCYPPEFVGPLPPGAIYCSQP